MADLESLARRAVACAGWRWVEGMMTDDGYRVLCVDGCKVETSEMCTKRYHGYELENVHSQFTWGGGCLERPDLDDPATVGCLLALVREQWGTVYTKPEEDRWTVRGPTGHIVGQGMTEAAALVAALEVQDG